LIGKSLFLILTSVILGVSGQLCLKAGMDRVGALSAGGIGSIIQTGLRVVTTPLVFAGLALYGIGALTWLMVLSKLDLSLAYPMLALTYILIPLAARFILGEQVPALRWLGVGIIFIGVAVVSQT
jgi:undecaprenyl phosphate-alpha-L-ara4N flippase subunit ArnE